MNADLFAARRAAARADNLWQDELTKQFGNRAGDVRYTTEAQGEEGSALRLLYDDWRAANDRLLQIENRKEATK